jgi:hypothetical protein
MHILRLGIHCSEAILSYFGDDTHKTWHGRHQIGTTVWEQNKPGLLRSEKEGTYWRLEDRLVRAASQFTNCRPIKENWVYLGWYDGETQLVSP